MGPCLVPSFEEYRPDAHGTPDPRIAVRAATPGDVAGMAAVARLRGPQPATLDALIAGWVSDDERRLVVALRREASGGGCDVSGGGGGVPDDEGSGGVPDDEGGTADGAQCRASGGGVVVGWGMANRRTGHADAPDGYYIGWLVVHPDCRRRGIAGRIVTDLAAWTSGRADRLYSVVNLRNRVSLDLHARHGFRELARAAQFAGIPFDGGVGLLLAAEV
ncbi:MAG: GNAT family N-acetyltransferase [Micrococcales bacterium]|nr:GNAT family N-acetyltransferase [Micrococcales bacterium]